MSDSKKILSNYRVSALLAIGLLIGALGVFFKQSQACIPGGIFHFVSREGCELVFELSSLTRFLVFSSEPMKLAILAAVFLGHTLVFWILSYRASFLGSLLASASYGVFVPGVSCFSNSFIDWALLPFLGLFFLNPKKAYLVPAVISGLIWSLLSPDVIVLPFFVLALAALELCRPLSSNFKKAPGVFFVFLSLITPAVYLGADGTSLENFLGTIDSHVWPHFMVLTALSFFALILKLRPESESSESIRICKRSRSLVIVSWGFAGLFFTAQVFLSFALAAYFVRVLSSESGHTNQIEGPVSVRKWVEVISVPLALVFFLSVFRPVNYLQEHRLLKSLMAPTWVEESTLSKEKSLFSAIRYQPGLEALGYQINKESPTHSFCKAGSSKPNSLDVWLEEIESSDTSQIVVGVDSPKASWLREGSKSQTPSWEKVLALDAPELFKRERGRLSNLNPSIFRRSE